MVTKEYTSERMKVLLSYSQLLLYFSTSDEHRGGIEQDSSVKAFGVSVLFCLVYESPLRGFSTEQFEVHIQYSMLSRMVERSVHYSRKTFAWTPFRL
jgi:hypothetical protein